ncbi:hypothetical protein MO973_05735 [Paenibacillus sp. TRM 82003]|nr:hypothetical protein [Paenibacillus sp. TRM 82003]
MRRWTAGFLAGLLSLSCAVAGAAPSTSIQQQGLTVHELDKELERLTNRESEMNGRIVEHRTAMDKQAIALEERSASAGKVLRAYYMGQRDQLWLLLFKMRSLSEALLALDYVQAIVRNDFRTLEAYKATYREQQTLLAELESQQTELRRIIADYERQRERLTAEQAELDRQLALLEESERAAELEKLDALTNEWEQHGIPIMENVLGALSSSMDDLPQLLSDPSYLEMNGTDVQIRLSDDAFNAFLRERNPLFDSFAFAFDESGLTVHGELEGRQATLRGAFLLEKEPVNALKFQIDGITFNGYELPDTTRTTLQEQYVMTFEPGRLFTGLAVSELMNEEGQLRVQLTFDGFSLAQGR